MARRLAISVIVISAFVAACAGNVATSELQGVAVEPPRPKPSFVLTDTTGKAFDFAAETKGKLTLLYFGYLSCPDICPVHLAQIAEVFDQTPSLAGDTKVVFVSVDPHRDTMDDIRRYLDSFDTRFIGLSGTPEELEVAQAAAGVPAARIVGDGEGYTVDHAGWVIAYAPDGLNHTIYPFGTRQTQWRNDLQILTAMR